MVAPAPAYDLMLMLDLAVDDARRAKIVDDARALIQAHGKLLNELAYGTRPTVYEIDHQGEAHYELLQFEGPRELLEQLQRALGITDGVVRFRIIKVRPGTPAAPDLRHAAPVAEVPEAADAVAEPAAG